MAYIDDLRELRAKVQSGTMDLGAAAAELSARTAGGWTALGARRMLSKPVSAVIAEYATIQRDALAGLDRVMAAKARRVLEG